MESEDKNIKGKEDIKLGELFGLRSAGLELGSILPESDFVEIFIQALKTLLERNKASQASFASTLFVFLRKYVPFTEIRGNGEFQNLLEILTRKDFYKTATRELQERYVQLMLEYMLRHAPSDYRALLALLDSYIRLIPSTFDDISYLNQIAKSIVQRLAGDVSTDAPPPAKKIKRN